MKFNHTAAFLAASLLLSACATAPVESVQSTNSSLESTISTENTTTPTELPSEVTRYASLSDKSEYYPVTREITEDELKQYFDEKGLAVTLYHDERVYHPVDLVWNMMLLADSYDTTKNSRYWNMLEANLKYALDGSELDSSGARWFVYRFDHSHNDMHMRAPWVSAMSQGMMLSIISRMYDHHPSEELKQYANEIFESFLAKRKVGNFWVTNEVPCPDTASIPCLFLEEYPIDDKETHVINGHIYAMLGLHDYYRMTKNSQAKDLFERSAHAIAHSFTTYRNPGAPSFYAISSFGKETWGTPESYHMGVIKELESLTKITGDSLYQQQAAILREDFAK